MTRDQPLTDRRRFLAAAAFAASGALAGCPSDSGGGGTDTTTPGGGTTTTGPGTTTAGDSEPLELPSDAVEALSLTQTGRETVSTEDGEAEIVAYQRDRESPLAGRVDGDGHR